MSETLTPTPDAPKSFDEHADDVLAMSKTSNEERDEFMRKAAATAEQFAETTANNKRAVGGAIKDTLLATGTVAGLATLGALGGNAMEHQANTVSENNQQWQQEAEESLHDSQVENGVLPEEMQEAKNHLNLNPEASPSPSEIPSPTQSSVDVQLPMLDPPADTIPSPETR